MPQQNNEALRRSVKKYLLVCALLNSLWAGAIATLYATFIHAFLSHGNTSGTDSFIASILGWVITFAIAFFQGAVFIGAASLIGWAVYSIFFANRDNNTPAQRQEPAEERRTTEDPRN